MKKLNPVNVYLIMSASHAMFTTLIFTVNLVYQATTIGLNPMQLVLVGTTLEITAFIFQVPTGVFADVFSRRLSINTQLILREESYFNRVNDPAAGCWYLEWLTDQLMKKAREPACAPTERQKVFVGVNRYADLNERALERLTIAPDEDRDAWVFEKQRLEAERK